MSAIYKDGTLYPTGGSGSSGHTILDNTGTSLTDEPNLKFGGDFEVSDDSENELTEVKPHELTSADMAEIMSTLPGTPTDMPVLFDESGAEYVVGKYVNSQGKWKPVYQKSFSSVVRGTVLATNVENIMYYSALRPYQSGANYYEMFDGTNHTNYLCIFAVNGELKIDAINSTYNAGNLTNVIVRYTKTTDTWND